MMADILVVRCKAFLPPNQLQGILNHLKAQKEEGVVILPSYLEAKIVPDDIKIKFDDNSVKQCDRCRKFYKNYSSSNDAPYHNVIRKFKTNCHGEVVEGTCSIAYDLCRECMTEFDEFMSNGGKFNDKI